MASRPVAENVVTFEHVHTTQSLERRLDGGIGSTIDPALISIPERLLVACLQGVAIYNAVELLAIIFYTFRRRSGLYFWSLMISTIGVALNASAFVVNDNGLTTHRVIIALMIIGGWIPMTTGQAFVLYSRLHLLYIEPRILKLVLIMIITNAVIGHVPTAIVIFGSNSNEPDPFLLPYSIYEKVEVTIFFLQEVVLSGMYLFKCLEFWKSQSMREARQIRNIIQHLVAVHLLIVALDITILCFEYKGLYVLQTSYKAFVYSVKLKMEISILNRLVDFVRVTRGVDFDWVTREIEQEWHETLQRTVGNGRAATAVAATGTKPDPDLEKACGVMMLAAVPESPESTASETLGPSKTGPASTPSPVTELEAGPCAKGKVQPQSRDPI